MTPTQTGTVKWFNESKGFGFIAQDAGGADLFAHFRDIPGTGFKTLTENQRVEFEVKQGQKGLQAANIRVLVRDLPGLAPRNEAAVAAAFFRCVAGSTPADATRAALRSALLDGDPP